MEFPSLWAPIATVTKGLLKEQGLLQEKDSGSGRQAEAVGAGAHGGRIGERHKERAACQTQELVSLMMWTQATGRPADQETSSAQVPDLWKQPSSPDRVPHVESIQRLCAVGAPSCQANKCWQPIGHVDEFVADGPRLLQQRARDKSNCPDPSFPQWPLPPSQWPVASTAQRLTSVVCQTTRGTKCDDTRRKKIDQ